jgi:hypothetical protein
LAASIPNGNARVRRAGMIVMTSGLVNFMRLCPDTSSTFLELTGTYAETGHCHCEAQTEARAGK